MSRPCVGYCGGHYPQRELRGTTDGPMCGDYYQRYRHRDTCR